MSIIGAHIRLTTTLFDVIERAERLALPLFQTFVSDPKRGIYHPPPEERTAFLDAQKKFQKIIIHSSYLTNLCNDRLKNEELFLNELDIALSLGSTIVVLHPGARGGHQKPQEALDTCIRRLNSILKSRSEITILLENVAHASRAIGGDLKELHYLISRSDRPEQLGVCLDTAHAHAWGQQVGYDLAQQAASLLSAQKIQLIHLNDTLDELGSFQDRHTAPGTGTIGLERLKDFMRHPAITNVPMIIEAPASQEAELPELLAQLKNN